MHPHVKNTLPPINPLAAAKRVRAEAEIKKRRRKKNVTRMPRRPNCGPGRLGASEPKAIARKPDMCGSRDGHLISDPQDRPVAPEGGGGSPSDNPLWVDLDVISWRLISPSAAERLALDAIRHRASAALACTTAAQLAGDLGTTRHHAAALLVHLHRKGWIVPDCRRVRWLPTSMAALAYRMPELESIVRGLAGLSAVGLPETLRHLVAVARSLWADASPTQGFVAHPSGETGQLGETPPQAIRRRMTRWWRLRRSGTAKAARARALRDLAALIRAA